MTSLYRGKSLYVWFIRVAFNVDVTGVVCFCHLTATSESFHLSIENYTTIFYSFVNSFKPLNFYCSAFQISEVRDGARNANVFSDGRLSELGLTFTQPTVSDRL